MDRFELIKRLVIREILDRMRNTCNFYFKTPPSKAATKPPEATLDLVQGFRTSSAAMFAAAAPSLPSLSSSAALSSRFSSPCGWAGRVLIFAKPIARARSVSEPPTFAPCPQHHDDKFRQISSSLKFR